MVEEQLKLLDGSIACGSCGVPLLRSNVMFLTNTFDTMARENQSPLTESKFYNSNLCNNKWLRMGHQKLHLPKSMIKHQKTPSLRKKPKANGMFKRRKGPKILRMKVIERGDTQNLVPMDPEIFINGANSNRM